VSSEKEERVFEPTPHKKKSLQQKELSSTKMEKRAQHKKVNALHGKKKLKKERIPKKKIHRQTKEKTPQRERNLKNKTHFSKPHISPSLRCPSPPHGRGSSFYEAEGFHRVPRPVE
jgi:hypothetical protein